MWADVLNTSVYCMTPIWMGGYKLKAKFNYTFESQSYDLRYNFSELLLDISQLGPDFCQAIVV